MNRKAQVTYLLENWPRIIFLFFVLAGLTVLIMNFTSSNVETTEAKAGVLMNRIFYSSVLWADDGTGEPLIGVVNVSRMEPDVLNSEISYPDERHAAARVALLADGIEERVVYMNSRWYDRWEPVAEAGTGEYSLYVQRLPVSYVENKTRKRGVLEARVILPTE